MACRTLNAPQVGMTRLDEVGVAPDVHSRVGCKIGARDIQLPANEAAARLVTVCYPEAHK